MDPKPKPFLKWAGGKRSIMGDLSKCMPHAYIKYHEGFVGGGALFFNECPKNAEISDINPRLIMCYNAIKHNVDLVIKHLEIMSQRHSPDFYYAARDIFNSPHANPYEIAALMIYLNRTCFNGLFRENKKGGFNVPIGTYSNPKILDEENLRRVSVALSSTVIKCRGFQEIEPTSGDFYYFDPPYDGTFNTYTRHGFGSQEQTELASLAKSIDAVGGLVMISNSNTALINKLYDGFFIKKVTAKRSISRNKTGRGDEVEVLITNYEVDENDE